MFNTVRRERVCVNYSSLVLSQVSNFDLVTLYTMPFCHVLIFYFYEVALKLSSRLTESCLNVVLSWDNGCLVIDPSPSAFVNIAAKDFVELLSTKYFPRLAEVTSSERCPTLACCSHFYWSKLGQLLSPSRDTFAV